MSKGEAMSAREAQPLPVGKGQKIGPLVKNDLKALFKRGIPFAKLVSRDIDARMDLGKQIYGTELRSHNGRDSVLDAYQECLDGLVYIRQAIYEGHTDLGIVYANLLSSACTIKAYMDDKKILQAN